MLTETERLSSPTEAESVPTSSIKSQLLQSFKTGKEYRHAFISESVSTSIAAQIKTIREQRKMSRPELAKAMDKSPSWIFRLEDPNEKPPTVSTLLEVAVAFDTDLNITFGSFSSLLDRLSKLSPESFEVPNFDEELPDLERQVAAEEEVMRKVRELAPTTKRKITIGEIMQQTAAGNNFGLDELYRQINLGVLAAIYPLPFTSPFAEPFGKPPVLGNFASAQIMGATTEEEEQVLVTGVRAAQLGAQVIPIDRIGQGQRPDNSNQESIPQPVGDAA